MPTRPNVLLILADQHRYDWIEGIDPRLPIRTPNLKRLQRRGITFSRVTTPAPLCAPARACLVTGRDYDRGPVPSNAFDLPQDYPTYFRALRDTAGYFVAGVGKFDLHKATFDWNLDGSRLLHEWGMSDGIDNEGKFDTLWSSRQDPAGPKGPYMKHLFDEGMAEAHLADFERRRGSLYSDTTPSPLSDEDYLDNWIASNARKMLDRRPADTPWHLMINFAGPHDPMDVPASLVQRWADVVFPDPPYPIDFDGDYQEVCRRYAAMVENLDRHVGDLLDLLEAEGQLENTLVIYSSDHGEMLGEHGVWGKSVALEASIRIPLIVSGAGVTRRDEVVDALVTLEDVCATILEAAGVDGIEGMTAQSLGPVLRGESATHRGHLISGLDRPEHEVQEMLSHYGDNPWLRLASWRTVTAGTLKVAVSPQLERAALFDLAADPHEENDLAPDRPADVDRMVELLTSSIGPYPRPGGARS
jgi:arylsulfatase A-like enzyme